MIVHDWYRPEQIIDTRPIGIEYVSVLSNDMFGATQAAGGYGVTSRV